MTTMDGSSHELHLGPLIDGERVNVRRIAYDFMRNITEVETTSGRSIEIDMPQPGQDPPIEGRPIVYLDQNHWSTLSNQLHEPAKVPQEEKAAAQKIIAMARNGEVIIPFSSGHFLETSALYGARRMNLGSTIIQISHGWRMRHPVRVRMNEIRMVLTKNVDDPKEVEEGSHVFTLDATALMHQTKPPVNVDGFGILAFLVEQLSTTQAHYDILLDPDPIERVRDSGWEDHLRSISRDPEWRSYSKERRRKESKRFALADAAREIAEVAATNQLNMPPEEIMEILEKSLASMPFAGLYADVLYSRLSQFEAKWESNDLIDMLYLTSATAYADIVVGEKAAKNYISAAWNARQGVCPIVKTLADAADRL
ncbi:hypothetical protein RB625_22765 [Streptomyces californicus]|uniref:hypothetical protein n=1 Tax=Streptomyces californicus TaxID=67351 RepID=UPI00296FB065|nr:hypothetical protein [Streptomyces californicus]MDW4901236.1 hypothetical protein [Streptomyces californicus]